MKRIDWQNASGWKKNLVLFKKFLRIGYSWTYAPVLGFIGAGTIKEYVFPDVNFYVLVLVTSLGFILAGYIAVKLGLYDLDLSYDTKRNSLLMKGLFKNGKFEKKSL